MMAGMGIGVATQEMAGVVKAKEATSSVFRIIDRQSAINPTNPEGKKLSAVQGTITFENVDFAYPTRPNIKVYDQFNLCIQSGETVALVGASGGGKSTAVSLIQRFYDPIKGRVLLDGEDIRGLNLVWLRQQMGLVSQEPVLFSGTIASNIAYGMENATKEQVFCH